MTYTLPDTPERKYTISLSDIRREDAQRVGGKAANLGELLNLGVPVPNGFAITAEAFEFFSRGTEEITERSVLCTEIPGDLRKEILSAYHSLCGHLDLVAVRSSAVGEDSEKASFAGVNETFLNTDKDNLLNNIKKCWASCYSNLAEQYKSEMGVELAPAVLVQKMINAKAAGVIFTKDPVHFHIYDEWLRLEVVSGVGEKLVSSKEIGEKLKTFRESHGPQRAIIYTQELDQDNHILTEFQVRSLADMALQIEWHFDRKPQDIEWALSNENNIYIIQARPITTIRTLP